MPDVDGGGHDNVDDGSKKVMAPQIVILAVAVIALILCMLLLIDEIHGEDSITSCLVRQVSRRTMSKV